MISTPNLKRTHTASIIERPADTEQLQFKIFPPVRVETNEPAEAFQRNYSKVRVEVDPASIANVHKHGSAWLSATYKSRVTNITRKSQ
ncbi:unnamed protein product, partial [Dicrocoelium dendriticum]